MDKPEPEQECDFPKVSQTAESARGSCTPAPLGPVSPTAHPAHYYQAGAGSSRCGPAFSARAALTSVEFVIQFQF